jgi:chorismate dehydratase
MESVTSLPPTRLRIAAIRFLNPAPLMWDFEHPPLADPLAARYQLDWMLPSECADSLAAGTAEIGLIPIAALPLNPTLSILPGCVIASKKKVRSLLLIRRAAQELKDLRSVAADTASRATLAYTRILFHRWQNPSVPFLPMTADLDQMLAQADAAILIGDPALLALEDAPARLARTGEPLVYHDLAEEWELATGLPWVSAVWGAAHGNSLKKDIALHKNVALGQSVAEDFLRSRDHGLKNIDALARQWAPRIGLTEDNVRLYLTENIHYVLDRECLEAMRCFFSLAAQLRVLPAYSLPALNI